MSTLFPRRVDGTFGNGLVHLRLNEVIADALLAETTEEDSGPPVYTDALDDAFWRMTARADMVEMQALRADLAASVLRSASLTAEELAAVAAAANTARIRARDGTVDPDIVDLLGAVMDEAAEALLDAETD
jgi:hypothetical protein